MAPRVLALMAVAATIASSVSTFAPSTTPSSATTSAIASSVSASAPSTTSSTAAATTSAIASSVSASAPSTTSSPAAPTNNCSGLFRTPGGRRAVLWLEPYWNVSSVEGYAQIYAQLGALAPFPGLVVAGSAYAAKEDPPGSFGYANTTSGEGLFGNYMEAFGFPAFHGMNLTVTAMVYFTHYVAIATILRNPQPFVTAVLDRVRAQRLSGVDLDYEPQNVARAVAEIQAERGAAASAGPDPFIEFLDLLGEGLCAQGGILTIDVNGDGSNTPPFPQATWLGQVNTEDGFGVHSVSDLKALVAADAPGLDGIWAPGLAAGSFISSPPDFAATLLYAASLDAATVSSSVAMWTNPFHEWNVGPQPQWVLDGIKGYLTAK